MQSSERNEMWGACSKEGAFINRIQKDTSSIASDRYSQMDFYERIHG